jgi:hypothetical protein
VKRPANLPLKGGIDHLMLLDPALIFERPGDDAGSEMIAITG